MENQAQQVQFYNQQITVLCYDNKPYIAMKPICTNIGLDWHAQRQRIHRHHVLSQGEVIITAPSKSGEQEYVCLPLSMLNGWLFGIDTNRVKPEIRKKLEQYQLECFDVLYNHFMPKVAKEYPNTISTQQQHAIREAVNRNVSRTGRTFQAVYHDLYTRFQIPKYQDLLAKDFDEAITYLGTPQLEQKKRYDFPIETADPHDRMFANAWMTPRVMLDKGNRAPDLELLEALQNDGYDVTGAKVRIYALYNTAERFFEMRKELQKVRQYLGYVDCLVRNSTYEKGINIMFYGEEKGTGIDSYAPRFL